MTTDRNDIGQPTPSARHVRGLSSDANTCFVCGPGNSRGLHVSFTLDNEVCVAQFVPRPADAGYDNVTHGGILFALLDDVMANWLWLQGERCFTARADIRYHEPLPIGTPVQLEGRCRKRKRRLALMESEVRRLDNHALVASATGSFMLVTDAD